MEVWNPQTLDEVQEPFDAFRGYAENCKPCALRGLAPKAVLLRATAKLRGLQQRCLVSFDPSSQFFHFEECHVDGASDSQWRLLNPGRVAMDFQDFLSACQRSTKSTDSASGATVSLVNVPYDADEMDAMPDEPEVLVPLKIPLEDLKELALYCVEDASSPPWRDLLEDFGPLDPSSRLPAFQALRWQLKERRIWMSSGGAKGASSVSAGFHWDHMHNIHVVLSGSKEVFLVPPLLAPALRATRFCPQAQWQMDCNCDGRMTLQKAPMISTESSTDYALVSIDLSDAENLRRHPQMSEEMKERPFKVVLKPGDAIYIPPGWWHSIRTHRPSPEDTAVTAVPLALSVNFWYDLPPELKNSYASVLLTLEILSRQRAMAELPQDRISQLLSEAFPAKETLEFEVVD